MSRRRPLEGRRSSRCPGRFGCRVVVRVWGCWSRAAPGTFRLTGRCSLVAVAGLFVSRLAFARLFGSSRSDPGPGPLVGCLSPSGSGRDLDQRSLRLRRPWAPARCASLTRSRAGPRRCGGRVACDRRGAAAVRDVGTALVRGGGGRHVGVEGASADTCVPYSLRDITRSCRGARGCDVPATAATRGASQRRLSTLFRPASLRRSIRPNRPRRLSMGAVALRPRRCSHATDRGGPPRADHAHRRLSGRGLGVSAETPDATHRAGTVSRRRTRPAPTRRSRSDR